MRKNFYRKIIWGKELCRQNKGCQDGVYIRFPGLVFFGNKEENRWKYRVFWMWKKVWIMWITLCSVLWIAELCQMMVGDDRKERVPKSVKSERLFPSDCPFGVVHFDERKWKEKWGGAWQEKINLIVLLWLQKVIFFAMRKKRSRNWQSGENMVQWRPWL